jgi:hypothetical protein
MRFPTPVGRLARSRWVIDADRWTHCPLVTYFDPPAIFNRAVFGPLRLVVRRLRPALEGSAVPRGGVAPSD